MQSVRVQPIKNMNTGATWGGCGALFLAIGLISGWIDALARIVLKFVFLEPLFGRWTLLWLIPLADSAIVVTVGYVVLGIVWAFSSRIAVRAAVAAVGLTGALTILLTIPIAPWARTILAVGILVRTASWQHPITPAMTRLALRWSGAVLVVLALVAAGGLLLDAGTRWQLQATMPTPPVGHPNVILITLDTERAESMRLYGGERPTSISLEVLAASSTVFDRAYSTSSWTLPSHASIMTGRYPSETSADFYRALDASYPTVAERFRDAGYLTAGFIANQTYLSREFGIHRGFLDYYGIPLSVTEGVLSGRIPRALLASNRVRRLIGYDGPGRKSAQDIVAQFLEWYRGNKATGRPFFAFLNLFDAHSPYLPPREAAFADPDPSRRFDCMVHGVRTSSFDITFGSVLTAAELETELLAYEGAVRYVDTQIGRLIDSLAALQLLDNTVLIITSDHGELLGEHGRIHHSVTLYSQETWVPLLVRYPGTVPQGRRIQVPVTLRDLSKTMLDLAGMDTARVPGSSLQALWRGGKGTSSPVLSSLVGYTGDRWLGLVDDSLRYIRTGQGGEALFNIMRDPREQSDLASDPNMQGRLEGMRVRLGNLERTKDRVRGWSYHLPGRITECGRLRDGHER